MGSRWLFPVVLGLAWLCFTCFPTTTSAQEEREELSSRVIEAKEKAVAYLMRERSFTGAWEFMQDREPGHHKVVGCTALCALALMECKVPENHKIIQDAATVIRRWVNSPDQKYNYTASLALVFFHRLHGGSAVNHPDAKIIGLLARQIMAGQFQDGGWGYQHPWHMSDNSNTQFGIVALWIARKYDIKGVDECLLRAAQKFRRSQRPNGGWGYDAGGGGGSVPYGSMTCAGLLGLALQEGIEHEARFRGNESTGDETDPLQKLEEQNHVKLAKGFLTKVLQEWQKGVINDKHPTYFLWSLERVATLYGWRKINDIKWYTVGVDYLVPKQNRDGSWKLDDYQGPYVDTAFALLFLAKSDLLGPLEATFRPGSLSAGRGKDKDGGKKTPEITLEKPSFEQLLARLPKAPANEVIQILEDLAAYSKFEHTKAIAEALSKMPAKPSHEIIRDELKQRMKNYSEVVVTECINNRENRELRVAAVRSTGPSKNKGFVPLLITLLDDADPLLSGDAHEALKTITEENLQKSRALWERWYRMNSKKP